LKPTFLEFLFLAKSKNKKIVFTNGCFDILHQGHVSYLNQARALGDLLIVGLNADESVKRLKGPTRPINHESERKYILENLKAVDWVEIFREDTPLELIKKITPNVLVKGGDWTPDKIIGSDFVLAQGGIVQSLSFISGKSSSNIIEKIRSL